MMSTFLHYLTHYLQAHPLPEGDLVHDPLGDFFTKWLLLRVICTEHGESVEGKKRGLNAIDKRDPLFKTPFCFYYFESKDGFCFDLEGPLSLAQKDEEVYQDALSWAKEKNLDVQLQFSPPILESFLNPDKSDITLINEDLVAWKVAFDQSWLDYFFSPSSSSKPILRL